MNRALIAALAFALLALLVQLGLTTSYDEAGLRAALAMRTPALTSMMLVVTGLGGTFLLPFALGFAVWLRIKRSGATAIFYFVTCLTGWSTYALLKMLFARPRPTLIPKLHAGGWVSFPSGHAMVATVIFGLAMVLATERAKDSAGSRAIRAVGSLAIAGVAISRVYLGVHYPSDVIAGVLGGWAWIGLALVLQRNAMAPRS